MRFVYLCPKCSKWFSAESEQPEQNNTCPSCGQKVLFANCDKKGWESLTDERKNAMKQALLQGIPFSFDKAEIEHGNSTIEEKPEKTVLSMLESLDNNVSEMKKILQLFKWIIIINAVITFIVMLVLAVIFSMQ